MSRHKSAHEVTLAPAQEKAGYQAWIEDNWKLLAGIGIALAVVTLWQAVRIEDVAEQRDRSWTRLSEELRAGGFAGMSVESTEGIAAAADALEGTDAGPWARLLETIQRYEAGDFQGALTALDALESEYPGHGLVVDELPLDPASPSPGTRLIPLLRKRIAAARDFREEHPDLFSNPPLPEGAPRVRIHTTAGSFVVGLYEERAPRHVANFLERCRQGEYDGTKFHRVVKGSMVQGGDPNSIEGDPSTWGQGGGGETIEPEMDGLYHFEGALAAAKKPNATESSASQFYVTTGDAHQWDGEHTVFGVLLEGDDVIARIESGAIAEGSQDRPADPVTIESTEVL